MISRYLTLIVMMACGGAPCERGICVSPAGPNPYTEEALNAYVATLAGALAVGGHADFASTVYGSRVTWVDADVLDCGGVVAGGCYDGYMIRVTVETCLGETSLAHELVHAYLDRAGDMDVDHKAAIWGSNVLLPLMKGFCGDKYKHRTHDRGL